VSMTGRGPTLEVKRGVRSRQLILDLSAAARRRQGGAEEVVGERGHGWRASCLRGSQVVRKRKTALLSSICFS